MTTYCDDIISDMHKDVYGYRPREGFYNEWKSLNRAQRETLVNRFQELLKEKMAEEKILAHSAFKDWKKTLKEMMQNFGISRARALRWHIESFNDDYVRCDFGFYCYELGLDYKLERVVEKILKKGGEYDALIPERKGEE